MQHHSATLLENDVIDAPLGGPIGLRPYARSLAPVTSSGFGQLVSENSGTFSASALVTAANSSSAVAYSVVPLSGKDYRVRDILRANASQSVTPFEVVTILTPGLGTASESPDLVEMRTYANLLAFAVYASGDDVGVIAPVLHVTGSHAVPLTSTPAATPIGRVTGPVKVLKKVFDEWGLNAAEMAKLLDYSAADDAVRLVTGRLTLRGQDREDRVRHLVKIHDALSQLLGKPEAVQAWLRRAMPDLNNKSPLSILLNGKMEDIVFVRHFVLRLVGR